MKIYRETEAAIYTNDGRDCDASPKEFILAGFHPGGQRCGYENPKAGTYLVTGFT